MSHYNKEMASLYTTTKCNLDCKYCYTNKKYHQEQKLNMDFAKAMIRDYFSRPEYAGFRKMIRFFAAGEPTLNLDAIKESINYAHEIAGGDVEVELQTNGIYLRSNGDFDYNTATWIAKNIDYIWVSCDGTPDIQNDYRPIFKEYLTESNLMSSSKIIEESFRLFQSSCKKMFGTRMTVVEKNIERQKEMIDYFHGFGIHDVWADPLFPSVGRSEPFEPVDLERFAIKFCEASEYASSFGVDKDNPQFDHIIYGSNYTCNFDEQTRHYCRACKPVPHATTDGYITSCDMAMFKEEDDSLSNHMNELIYGKWDGTTGRIDYDMEKLRGIRNRNCDTMKHCVSCVARLHCGGYCLGEVTNESKRIDGALPHKCKTVRYLYEHMNDRQRKYRYSHP